MLILASFKWMTADEIVSACLLLLLIVAAIWVHSRSKKIK
jgi:hypothetical protein